MTYLLLKAACSKFNQFALKNPVQGVIVLIPQTGQPPSDFPLALKSFSRALKLKFLNKRKLNIGVGCRAEGSAPDMDTIYIDKRPTPDYWNGLNFDTSSTCCEQHMQIHRASWNWMMFN